MFHLKAGKLRKNVGSVSMDSLQSKKVWVCFLSSEGKIKSKGRNSESAKFLFREIKDDLTRADCLGGNL